MNTLSPRQTSILIHFIILTMFLFITNRTNKNNSEKYQIPVVYSSQSAAIQLKEVQKDEKISIKTINKEETTNGKTREVFGLNRNSYTDTAKTGSGINVKMGNTTAKSEDSIILEKNDSDTLPTPTEEYLVSQMPRVIKEVRPIYPKEAREKQKSGSVVLDVLIDENGNVRNVIVLESEEIFKQEAVEAMKKFKFAPANINGKTVAVKIRYVIKFELEY